MEPAFYVAGPHVHSVQQLGHRQPIISVSGKHVTLRKSPDEESARNHIEMQRISEHIYSEADDESTSDPVMEPGPLTRSVRNRR